VDGTYANAWKWDACLNITAINQLYELEQKLKKHGDPNNLQRNLTRMKGAFEQFYDESSGFAYEDPMDQPFKETRTDLEASIAGSGTENLVVVEVLKPIIRAVVRDSQGNFSKVIQKGVVIVESKQQKTP